MAKTKRTTKRRPIKSKARQRRTPKRRVARKTPSRVNRNVVKSSGGTSHHAVMRMPFSTATAQPKIPDGKVATSLSRRLQKVVQLHNDSGESTLDIVMVPALGVCATVYGSDNASGTRGFEVVGFSGQTVGLNGGQLGSGNRLDNQGGISDWRIVSQAMKFQLNQTEEENDGWFEAVRFTARLDYGLWSVANLNNSLFTGSMGLVPNANFKTAILDPLASNMVEQPGYTTGLLKDIGKSEFKLNPKTNSVHFKKLKSLYSTVDAGGADIGTYDNTDKVQNFSNFHPETKEIFDDLLDRDYDMVYLRMHCRANDGTSTGSKLIMNGIQNIEFCFSPDSDLSTFQTPNQKHKSTDAVLDGASDRVAFTG